MALRWICCLSVHLERRREAEQTDISSTSASVLKPPIESFAGDARTGKVEIQPKVSAASPRRQVVDG
jgi:hypothetical protein